MYTDTVLQLGVFVVAIVIGVPVIIVLLRVIAGAAEAILSSAFIFIAIFIGVMIMVASRSSFFSG